MSFLRLPIADSSQIADARRRAKSLAVEQTFGETAAERVAIVATEAATNLLKHAGGGEILVGISCVSGESLVDIYALDKGPGMNSSVCQVDGFSTTGTAGTGLGAIARLSTNFDIYSRSAGGTVLFAQISKNGPPPEPQVRAHGIRLSKPGEEACGDHWGIEFRKHGGTLVVADGLGHGIQASTAAHAAVETMRKYPDLSPKDLVTRMHGSMAHTRGAAIGVAEFDIERRIALFSGLGNVTARILEGGLPTRHMVSINGTAGVEARTVREFSYPWPRGAAIVLHSDGLSARWELNDYPGLLLHEPGVIAGVLMRDHCRHTDDATVVVVK